MHLKKYIGFIFFTALTLSSMGQSKFSLGVSSGGSFHFNSTYNGYYTSYAIAPEFNIGIDAGLYVGAKSRLGVEVNYENMGIGRDWNLIDPSASAKTVKQTKMHVDNWGINFSYSYRLLQAKKLEVFGSTSLKASVTLADREKTTLMDGTINASNYLDYNYRHNRAGLAAGLRLKYNFTQHWALTILPEYTCYFRNFYYQSSGPLQSIRCNLGVELRF